jgi:hypothetical protein
MQDENGDLLAESHNTGGRTASLLLNMHNVSNARQIEIYTAEPPVPDSSFLQVEIVIANFKNCKSPGSDQIPAEMFQAKGETLMSEIHKLVNSAWNKEELPGQWNESIILSLWGASCCVTCTYTSQIYLRSPLRIFVVIFILSVHNMFRPLRAILK